MKKLLPVFVVFILAFNNLYSQGIDKPQYRIATYRSGVFLGNIDIELFPFIAPLATRNFDSLALALAYDSTAFHRVVPGFVIQGGDPNSIHGPRSTWGNGNPNQPNVNAEFSVARHYRGRIGAARDTAINSANSQFYICVADAFLDGNYTVYGQAIAGMDIADSIVNSPRDANDNPLQKISMFVTPLGSNSSIPPACNLLVPADQATAVPLNQIFQWSLVADAVINTAQFSTDSTFTFITDSVKTALTQVKSTVLMPSTKYYWRVKSNNGGHESPYSSVFSFNTTLAVPELIVPANLATGVSVNPILSWTSVPGNINYTLVVATSAAFGTSIVYNQIGIPDTSQQVNGLLPNTLYFWKVAASDTSVTGPFAVRHSFTTQSSTGINESHSDENIFSIYPNPVSSELFIDVNAKSFSPIEITISDLQGKVMKHENTFINSGIKTVKVDVNKIPAGNYILNILKNNSVTSFKIQIGVN